MLLRGHALERLVLAVPCRADVEKGIRLPLALLGLVRFEEIDRWRPKHLVSRLVPVRLRNDPRFKRQACRRRMIEVVRIVMRVREHKGRMQLRSEEHTSELQSLMRISYADICLKKKT